MASLPLLKRQAQKLYESAPSRSETALPDVTEFLSFSRESREIIGLASLSLLSGASVSEVKTLLSQVIEEEKQALKVSDEVVKKYQSFGPTSAEYLKAGRDIPRHSIEPVEWDEDDNYIAYLAEVSMNKRATDART